MKLDEVWEYVDSERAALAGILETLTPEQWQTSSLCPGWSVKDVAAHVISSPQVSAAQIAAALLRTRGNYDRAVFALAREAGRRPSTDIIGDYRQLRGSRSHPPGTSPLEPLLDVLVHTQDILRPLHLRHEMPVPAAQAAADRVWARSFPFHAKRRLGGYRLEATDADWAAGEGQVMEGPVSELLLLLTGRTYGLNRLSGDGAVDLQARTCQDHS